MVFVVEIQDRKGQTARKEYEAMNLRDALGDIERELRKYPQFHMNDIWQKGEGSRGIYSGTKM